MTAIVDLKLRRISNVRWSGIDQRMHTAIWTVETDETMDGDHVLAHAQGLVGSLPIGSTRVPQKYSFLAVDNGRIQTGITTDAGTWVSQGEGRYADGGAYALDFAVEPLQDGPCVDYEITVTFRSPVPGQFERPAFGNLFNNLASSLPTPPIAPTRGDQVVRKLNKDADPLLQPKEFNVEYVTRETEISQVLPVVISSSGSVLIGRERPFVNPNGEPYPPLADVETKQVVTVSLPVRDDVFAFQMNKLFKRTMNADTFSFQGQSVLPYTCRFKQAETSRTRVLNGTEYKMLTYRAEISETPYFESRGATGTFFRPAVGSTKRKQLFDEDGLPIEQEYPLKADGTFATRPQDQAVHLYTRYRPVIYGDLLR